MNQYYEKKRESIMKMYSKLSLYARETLEEHYPNEVVERIMKHTMKEGAELISRLPDVGKDNAFQIVINANGWIISAYKAMQQEEIEEAVNIYILRKAFLEYLRHLPKMVGFMARNIFFRRLGINYFKKQAEVSRLKVYPANFVYDINVERKSDNSVETDMIFSECAMHKMYEKENVPVLGNYCNFCDPLYGELWGMGVNADHTFAQYDDECRLCFNSKRETKTPENIVTMIKEAEKIFKTYRG